MVMRHFFVDEAGDLTLFDKRGRSMLGRDGVSQCFMVGVAEIRNPAAVETRLESLRRDLMSDPYFAGVASGRLLLVGCTTAIRACRRPILRRNCETDRIRLGFGRYPPWSRRCSI